MATYSEKTTRPGYLTDYTNQLINQINATPDSQYADLQYQGLNKDQQDSLNQMMNNSQFQGYVDQLMKAGEAGTNALDTAYGKISNLYQSGNITPQAVENLTQQLYNPIDVEAAQAAERQQIERKYSTETAPAIAMQTMQGGYAGGSGGFGSSQRLSKARAEESFVQDEQASASNIANNAYSNAQNQALSILNANAANSKSALAGLTANAGALAGNYTIAGDMSNQMLKQGVAASQQSLQDQQNALNVQYANQVGAQNQKLQNLQNRIGSAQAANGVLGMTTKTTTSGGGSGILGGAMAGAVTGFMTTGSPYGALAGAAIGGASAATQ